MSVCAKQKTPSGNSKAASAPLLFYLDYAFTSYREPEHEKTVADAVTTYVAVKNLQHERTQLSLLQARNISNELKIFVRRFPKGTMAQFTPAILLAYSERGTPSLKTYNSRRGILSTFLKHALQNEWVVSNPVEKTPCHRINHRRGSATTPSFPTTAWDTSSPLRSIRSHPNQAKNSITRITYPNNTTLNIAPVFRCGVLLFNPWRKRNARCVFARNTPTAPSPGRMVYLENAHGPKVAALE